MVSSITAVVLVAVVGLNSKVLWHFLQESNLQLWSVKEDWNMVDNCFSGIEQAKAAAFCL